MRQGRKLISRIRAFGDQPDCSPKVFRWVQQYLAQSAMLKALISLNCRRSASEFVSADRTSPPTQKATHRLDVPKVSQDPFPTGKHQGHGGCVLGRLNLIPVGPVGGAVRGIGIEPEGRE
jgi:hypothetical protein